MSHLSKILSLNSTSAVLAQWGIFKIQEGELLRGVSRVNVASSPQEQISPTSGGISRSGQDPENPVASHAQRWEGDTAWYKHKAEIWIEN